MSYEFSDAIGAYFEETSPNLWSYSDFLEKVVKPISHTLYDRDLIKANRVWKKRFISTVKDIANKEVPVVPQRAAAKILKPADSCYNNDQVTYFWKEMFENNKLQEERVALKRKAYRTALKLVSTSLDSEREKVLDLYSKPPPSKRMHSTECLSFQTYKSDSNKKREDYASQNDNGKDLQLTMDDYLVAVIPPSQVECFYNQDNGPNTNTKPFAPFISDNEDDSKDLSAEIDYDEDSEDDLILIDEHIKDPETTSFDEYVNAHKGSGWTLEDGRQVIDIIRQNTTRLAESVSKKSRKEQTPFIMSVVRLGFSSIVDLSSEYQGGMFSWFGDEWSRLKKNVYDKVNMIPNTFDGEIKTIIDTVEEMCGSYHYVDARDYLFKIRSKKKPQMVQQIATTYYHVIDKFLDNPHIFVEETGKEMDLSEMEYAINMTAPILNDVFNDVLDILKLHWGETLSVERRRKIDIRIVHKYKDIELSHCECTKAPTPVRAIRDRSKCLRTAKTILDRFLEEDLSDETVKDSTILGIQFAGLHGQIIGIDLLDDGLYFGLEGSHFSFPAQLSNIKCLRNALEALFFFKENIVRKANLFPDPKKYNHAYNKIFHNGVESKVKAKHFKTKFIRKTYFTPKGKRQAFI
ncbi:7788_t:CDS:10 [Paraglomus brasilianum]|uniref:7788_t:CDS:1 n=1 Tax=Paraglomus brasilianum TaxID=144538 RepID=A0A9N8ZZK6_9GLOM|nr:7788_t:CDS:10 [Paraglomus brasilianum]